MSRRRNRLLAALLVVAAVGACESFRPEDVRLELVTGKVSYATSDEAVTLTARNLSPSVVYIGGCAAAEQRHDNRWEPVEEVPGYVCHLVQFRLDPERSATITFMFDSLPEGEYRLRLYDVQTESDGSRPTEREHVSNAFTLEAAPN